jgi:pilus assembly protein CpaF
MDAGDDIELERDSIALRDIFLFVPGNTGADGKIEGQFIATGYRPRLLDDLARRGIALPPLA